MPNDAPPYSRANPSPHYRALADSYRRMHEEGFVAMRDGEAREVSAERAYRGDEVPKHFEAIKALIDRHGARTVIDYGSGKGRQYGAIEVRLPDGGSFPSIPAYWGVDDIVCYDPAVAEFAGLPEAPADGVVATDMLEHCHVDDVAWIVDEIFALSRAFVFATVACYPAKARLPDGRNAHITLRHPEWWHGLFWSASARAGARDFALCCIAPRKDKAGETTKHQIWYRREALAR